VGASWAVYYYFYALFKTYFGQKSHFGGTTALTNLGVGLSAGVISAIATNPIWVVNTRLKLRQTNSGTQQDFFKGMLALAREEGLQGLLSGVVPSLILVTNPAIQFAVYEKLKQLLLQAQQGRDGDRLEGRLLFPPPKKEPYGQQRSQLTALEFFLIGAVAKLIATVVTYPYQVVKSRLQAKQSKSARYAGVVDCIVRILDEEGVGGMFRGLQSKLVATILTSAIMFMSYEKLLIMALGVQKKLYKQKAMKKAAALSPSAAVPPASHNPHPRPGSNKPQTR